jgi:predicted transcriptional regulator
MGMLVVETVAKIRRDHDRGKPIKAIVRETGLSRNTVRKAVRAERGSIFNAD